MMLGSGVRVTEYAIWSRPELFSMRLAPEPGAGDNFRESLSQVVQQVLTLAQDMGGVMEYCHGVGMKLGRLPGPGDGRRASGYPGPERISGPGRHNEPK